MIGNKRIKLVMAGFLIAGATVTNITGVGSFADEIATFGTYNVYHYRPCACNTCFMAIQLFNATAAALNCISQTCCYPEHFHIQGLRSLPRWVQYSAFLQDCQYMVLFSTF